MRYSACVLREAGEFSMPPAGGYWDLYKSLDTQPLLDTEEVVVDDVILNHTGQRLPAGKTPSILPFPLEGTPDSLHRAIVNTLAHSSGLVSHPGCSPGCYPTTKAFFRASCSTPTETLNLPLLISEKSWILSIWSNSFSKKGIPMTIPLLNVFENILKRRN